MQISISINIERKHFFILLGLILVGIVITTSQIVQALTQNEVIKQSPAYHLLKDIYTIINGEYVPLNTSSGKINSSLMEITGNLDMNGYDITNLSKVEANEICLGGKCKKDWSELIGPSTTAYKWKYRKMILIHELSGTDLTDYQLLLTTDTLSLIRTNKMRRDCADIRFLDENGAYIPYWIESGCGTSSTKIWIKIPHLNGNSELRIYMYYGNPSAHSLSSKKDVFLYEYQTFSASSGCYDKTCTVSTKTNNLPDPAIFEPYKVYVDVLAGLVQDDQYEFKMTASYDNGKLKRTYTFSKYYPLVTGGDCWKKMKMNTNPIDITGDISGKSNLTFVFTYSGAGNIIGGCAASFNVYLNGYYMKKRVSPAPSVVFGSEETGNFILEDEMKWENIVTGRLIHFDNVYGMYEGPIDNDPSTAMNTLNWDSNSYLIIDLGETIDLAVVRLKAKGCVSAGGCPTSGAYIQGKIWVYISRDNRNWKLIGKIEGNTVGCYEGWISCVSENKNTIFWASKFRYIKIVLGGSGNRSDRKHYGSLWDLEILKVKM